MNPLQETAVENETETVERTMTLSDHLNELRWRLFLCIGAVLICSVGAYFFVPDVFLPIMRAPFDALRGDAANNPFVIETPVLRMLIGKVNTQQAQELQLYFTGVTQALVIRLKMALVIGVLFALPVIVFQIWSFVSLGLYKSERRKVLIYAPVSLILFLIGAAIAYFGILPVGIAFLLNEGWAMGMKSIITVDQYIPFVLWMMVALGVVFQMPLVAMFLSALGIVTPETLSKYRGVSTLSIFIVAAIITPPDIFSQVAVAIPMVLLYEVSIILARFSAKK